MVHPDSLTMIGSRNVEMFELETGEALCDRDDIVSTRFDTVLTNGLMIPSDQLLPQPYICIDRVAMVNSDGLKLLICYLRCYFSV